MLGTAACSALVSLPCPQPSSAVPRFCLPFGEKCCGLVGKGREAHGSERELLETSPRYPMQLNNPKTQHGRSSGLGAGRGELGAGRGELGPGSPSLLKNPSQRLPFVLGIPAGLSLPTLYLRHLSGISHQSAEAPGSEGSGQALFPLDWSDRSQGASGVPRAPWEPQSGHMHGRKQSHHPGAKEVRAEDLTEGA